MGHTELGLRGVGFRYLFVIRGGVRGQGRQLEWVVNCHVGGVRARAFVLDGGGTIQGLGSGRGWRGRGVFEEVSREGEGRGGGANFGGSDGRGGLTEGRVLGLSGFRRD